MTLWDVIVRTPSGGTRHIIVQEDNRFDAEIEVGQRHLKIDEAILTITELSPNEQAEGRAA